MDDLLARLKAANSDVELRDESLRQESQERRDSLLFTPESLREAGDNELILEGQRVDRQSLPRGAWRTDPRIPAAAQIKCEYSGKPPKSSRDHMTRRIDPVWGPDRSAAKGNDDSMHVINVVPRMQPFNAGVWLELEDNALQHARRDDMKIAIFTGPILATRDPVMFDVKIPVDFWKVIAFIHDDTRELCATGYTMSQKDSIIGDEFVFGKHKTAQRSLAWIDARTGLSFGSLTDVDPFEDEEGLAPELTNVRQIDLSNVVSWR